MLSETQKLRALKMLIDAVSDSVAEAGTIGAPGGVLYSAMMAHGVSLEQFESLMSLCVRVGAITRRGDLYFATGRAL